jgi:hypothetical protein|tara:strand:- start:4894 stop:5049 length:156 start_codon:yes stop_codon:yes gene_type:complete
MIIWKRPSSSLITLQDTPNMEEFALSQGWVKNENDVKRQENQKAKKKRNER